MGEGFSGFSKNKNNQNQNQIEPGRTMTMDDDPSSYLPAANGGRPPLLKIRGISARPELNGRFGQAVSFSADRYVVALLDAATAAAAASAGAGGGPGGPQPSFVKLRPENLAAAGRMDQLRFGAGMLAESAKAYVAGPTAQGWGRRMMDAMPAPLRARMTPSRALLGAAIAAQSVLVLVYLLLGRFLGNTKLFTLVSLLALVLAVSSPDWTEGLRANKPFKLIATGAAKNFPRRWKENLSGMTGYPNISERVALASLVFVLLFSGKVLLTPAPPSVGLPPRMPGDASTGGPRRTPRAPPRYDLEHIYKLGYDDATSGKEFGTSLPEDIVEYNASNEAGLSSARDRYDDFEWVPPPPPRSKPSLGMGTIFSMMTLYRFGKDVVTSPDDRIVFDPAFVMARLKSMEPWRLGMLGFSLYRVVMALRAFF